MDRWPSGVRTQTGVGTSSALILLISKYGFQDVPPEVILDPSRAVDRIDEEAEYWRLASKLAAALAAAVPPLLRRVGTSSLTLR